jgi:hypothetical protein
MIGPFQFSSLIKTKVIKSLSSDIEHDFSYIMATVVHHHSPTQVPKHASQVPPEALHVLSKKNALIQAKPFPYDLNLTRKSVFVRVDVVCDTTRTKIAKVAAELQFVLESKLKETYTATEQDAHYVLHVEIVKIHHDLIPGKWHVGVEWFLRSADANELYRAELATPAVWIRQNKPLTNAVVNAIVGHLNLPHS